MTDGPRIGRVDALLSGVRITQFLSVGIVGGLLDTATVVVLTTQVGIYRGYAKVVGAELAIVLMFLINEHWTFASEGADDRRSFFGRLARSNVVRLGGLVVGTVVFLLVSGLEVELPVGGEALWLTISNVVGIGVGFVVNYVAESLFTWRVGVDAG